MNAIGANPENALHGDMAAMRYIDQSKTAVQSYTQRLANLSEGYSTAIDLLAQRLEVVLVPTEPTQSSSVDRAPDNTVDSVLMGLEAQHARLVSLINRIGL